MPDLRPASTRWPRSVGILGAAALSLPITRRLLLMRPAAVRISVFGQSPAGTAELVQLGATVATSPADLTARSQIVLALVSSLAEIEAMVAGPRGLQAGVHSPRILVIGTGIGDGAMAIEFSRQSSSTGGLLRVVGASICGTATEADEGRLSITVAAGQEAYAGLRAVLEALGPPAQTGSEASRALD